MAHQIVILGGGGHACVVHSALIAMKQEVLGFCDPDEDVLLGRYVKRLGNDEALSYFSPKDVKLVNGIGSVGDASVRHALFCKYRDMGFDFLTVVHPSAVMGPDVVLKSGCQIMSGAIIQVGAEIGENTLVNTAAVVEHHCCLGEGVHVASGAILSGGVDVQKNVHVGAGATVIQGCRIGAGAIIGAGSVVTCDVAPNVTVVGVPAVNIQHRAS